VPLSRDEKEKEREAGPVPVPIPVPPVSAVQATPARPGPATAAAAPQPLAPAATQAAAPKPAGPSTAGELLPFGEGMTRPVLVERGKPVQYSREALEAKVDGTMIVRCTITTEGRVERCVVLKTLPFLEQAVLENLYSSRYTPVTFQGKPVSVGYTFNVRLAPPK
jgi:TonB family protein